jgi:hypothetical protein
MQRRWNVDQAIASHLMEVRLLGLPLTLIPKPVVDT